MVEFLKGFLVFVIIWWIVLFTMLPIGIQKSHKIDNWNSLSNIDEDSILNLTKSNLVSIRNLKLLRGMAQLICKLNLSQKDAALLLHSGIGSLKSLSSLTPTELLHKIGRLERQLKTGRVSPITFSKAKILIERQLLLIYCMNNNDSQSF